jgi:hypothetical protein
MIRKLRIRFIRLICGSLAALACGREGPAGFTTSIDSTPDTVFVRVRGSVPSERVHRLVEELRIAPTASDTSLFTQLTEFQVDGKGRMWGFDFPTSSILVFGSDGALIRRIGRKGGGPGEFQQANGIVALDTGLAVLDYANARISFFSDSGTLQTSRRVPTGFFTSGGLVIDHSGAVRLRRPVTAPREGEILGRMGLVRVSSNGALSDSLAPPDLPVPREVYVATHKGGTSSTTSSFSPNYYWAWHPDGYFVVGHGGNYEIVLARPGMKPLAIMRQPVPVAISDLEWEDEHKAITMNMQQTDPGWSWSGPPLPHTKAPLTGLRITRDGRIWAQVATPSMRIPEDEIDKPSDPRRPVRHFRSQAAYEVFGTDGRFLGRIELPLRTRLMDSDGKLLWVLGRDENDLPAMIRYRIEPSLP